MWRLQEVKTLFQLLRLQTSMITNFAITQFSANKTIELFILHLTLSSDKSNWILSNAKVNKYIHYKEMRGRRWRQLNILRTNNQLTNLATKFPIWVKYLVTLCSGYTLVLVSLFFQGNLVVNQHYWQLFCHAFASIRSKAEPKRRNFGKVQH
jgi:hypothetical protein